MLYAFLLSALVAATVLTGDGYIPYVVGRVAAGAAVIFLGAAVVAADRRSWGSPQQPPHRKTP